MSDNKELLRVAECLEDRGATYSNRLSAAAVLRAYIDESSVQPVVLSDEQYEAIRHASALLELEGYTEQSADLVAIFAAKEKA